MTGMAGKEVQKEVPRLLKLARQFNCFYISELNKRKCRPFVVAGHQVGLVRPDVMTQLTRYPDVFNIQPHAVTLNPAFRDYAERSAKLEAVLNECRAQGTFVTLRGWRDECFEVRPGFSSEPLLKMDRSATCLFGICSYGVDINGYVMDPEKGLCIWLQRRSQTKPTWPGKWDNMVGGGLSVGYSVLETAYKEAEEEASIPRELMVRLRPCGCVSFFFESERGLFPNTEFVFDLELPTDFVPNNKDGEVEKFELLPAQTPDFIMLWKVHKKSEKYEVLERVLSIDFKTTSCPVLVDFLIRHGIVSPETEPNFPELIELLHVPLQTLYSNKHVAENGEITTL